MPTAIVMPKLGMTMQEGTVIDWPIAPGERVEKGQVVLVIESEKAEVEVEATDSGCFRHVYVQTDEVVPCGTVLAALTASPDEDFDSEAFRASQPGPSPAAAAAAGAAPAAAAGAAPAAARAERAARAKPRTGAPATPVAKRLAREHGLALDGIAGSGPGGRITGEDVEAVIARRAALTPVADGVSLEVPAAGPEGGEPVLLVPGFGTDASAFARQIPALAERFRVHAVNPRGVGLSDAPESERYDVATAAADLAALCEAPAHVVGTSLGAAVALEFALAHPERVRSLSLIAPLVSARARLLAVIEAWCQMAAELPPAGLAAALLPWLFSETFLADDAARKRTARGLAQTVARIGPEALARWANGLRAWSGSRDGELANVAVPTLVLVAEEDLLTPDGEAMANAIPKARCVRVPGAGHAVMLEAPDAVNEALLAHLAGAA